MRSQKRWTRAAALVAAGVVLGACGDTAARATTAQVVVEVNTEEPLSLVISTNFEMVLNLEDGTSTPFLNDTDSAQVTVGYDETYDLDRTNPRFYARLANEEGENEDARMVIFLDGEVAYDVTNTLSAGTALEYIYHFNSFTVTGG